MKHHDPPSETRNIRQLQLGPSGGMVWVIKRAVAFLGCRRDDELPDLGLL
jgi:hypothetical protein